MRRHLDLAIRLLTRFCSLSLSPPVGFDSGLANHPMEKRWHEGSPVGYDVAKRFHFRFALTKRLRIDSDTIFNSIHRFEVAMPTRREKREIADLH